MGVHLLGIGTARPARSVSQSDAAAMAARRCCTDERQTRVRTLYRRTTIERRASALIDGGHGAAALDWFYPSPEVSAGVSRGPGTGERMAAFARLAPELAEPAVRQALSDADVAASRVTHLVVATCTGFAAPGLEVTMIPRIGLSPHVKRLHIGFMGCHAALNALQVAQAVAEADEDARIVVLAVELGSLHFQYGWEGEQVLANALFADGAAAMVIGRPGSPPAAWRLVDTASCLIDETMDLMTWRITDHGFVMSLSPRVPEVLATTLGPWLEAWLDRHGLTVAQVGSWAIHAGGPRIVQAVAHALGLGADAVDPTTHVLRHGGNMSSATILFILDRLRDRGADLPCVALSFGPGLVAEAALFG